jgi:dihydroorotate dehydrogenase (NAD+) catalytic subunit
MNLSVQLAPKHKKGLKIANPVMTASGTFGWGTEYEHPFDIEKLGAIVCKGTTLKPREGNPQPRIAETPCGVLNSIGLQNIGVEAVLKEKAPVWAGWSVPVIVNIVGIRIEDYAKIASMLDGVAGISGLEVNIGCPNIEAGGVEFGTRPGPAAEVTAAVKRATSLPVIVKLTPKTGDIAEVAKAVEDAGADAVSLINTPRGMVIDIAKRKPLLGNKYGGLSGPAVKPIALHMVYSAAGTVKIPVVGMGGITTSSDALEFIMAGASAIEVGTANFTNPNATLEILEGIKQFMKKERVSDISELIGVGRG